MKSNNGSYTAYLKYLLPALFWIILVLTSRDFLLQVEARSLFLFDWFWIKDFMNTPSGILQCLALFLTQFLHLPWMGSFIWVLLLALSAFLTERIYGISQNRSVLAWIPAFLLAGANMSIGYLIYIMNVPGYFFSPVLGYLFILAAVAIFRRISSVPVQIAFIAIWGFAGFWIAGYYAFAAIITTGTDHLCSNKRSSRFVPLITGIAVTVISPLVLYGLTTYNIPQSWSLGLPTSLYIETHFRTFLPVITATAVPVILPFIRSYVNRPVAKPVLLQTSVLTACIILLYLSWFKDTNYRTEISMIQSVNEMDWNRTAGLLKDLNAKADKNKDYQPTRVMVLLKDLALIKTGQEGQSAFAFDDGDMKQKKSYDIPMVIQIGRILYLHYGIPGFCHRWCLEENGEFGWSYDRIKYLIMTSISIGDSKLTTKYLDMMDHTLFYRKWSEQQRSLNLNRELAAKTAPYDKIFPLVCYDDQLMEDLRGCEYTLSHHFLAARPEQATPFYDRVALFWALKSQDSRAFWTKFLLYLDSSDPTKLERYYQEAAYMFGNMEKNRTLMALPYDKNTKDLYESFSGVIRKNEMDLKSLKDARRIIPSQLRYTYYYYYTFVRGLEQF